MPDGSVPLLLAIIALIVLSAIFSAIETAYTCASRIKLKTLASNGKNWAKPVLDLTEKFERLISTVLVGNNIVNLLAASLSTLFFAMIIPSKVDSTTISTIVLTVIILVFCEITPKYFAKVYPEKMAMLLYPSAIFFYYLLWPLTLIFDFYKWLLKKVFKLKADDVITEEEIMTIVDEAEEDGTFREEESRLIRSAIEFDDLEVGDVLVPRVNITAVDINSSMEEIREVFHKDGYSRIPVYRDSIDTIVGTIHEKDFFNAYLNGKKDLKNILQPAVYTTEHIKISALLKNLQSKKIHLAVVLDEYGGTLGIVTLEDILEELVGEIWDEHDEEISYFKQVDEETYIVDGKAPLSELMELFELDDEEENFDAATVSGWIIEDIGEIPKVGFTFTFRNMKIEIVKATVKRILEVKITKTEETTEE